MKQGDQVISLEEAVQEVEVAMRRVALLHVAFSKVLLEELGEGRGKELVVQAIMEYGRLITELVKLGYPDLPKFGVVQEVSKDDEGRFRGRGCILARVFKELDVLELGSLYCYVDAAKSMAADPKEKLIHVTCEACGDDFCTFEVHPTTEEERQAFQSKDPKWKEVDPRLVQD